MSQWLEGRARAMSLETSRNPVTRINVHARRQAEFAVLLVTTTTTLNVPTTTGVTIRLLYVICIGETMHTTKY